MSKPFYICSTGFANYPAWANSTKAVLSASGTLEGIQSESKYAHPILKTVGDQQGFEPAA